ncbi:MAG TPA: class I SAM-dependent methyltransferase, partial [Marinagarivorans sp.]
MSTSTDFDFSPLEDRCREFFVAEPMPRESRRIFHGRGRCYPGLEWCTLDFYSPVVLLTVFCVPSEPAFKALKQRLLALLPAAVSHFVIQRRDLFGAPYEWCLAEPLARGQVFAKRGKLSFQLDFNQQNTGYFLDMEPGRQWLAANAAGARVLNLFAYTCAFSVVAIEA